MMRKGRLVDSCFCNFHRLYYRCQREDFENDRLIAARIPYKNPSVNWSKYSWPWDVVSGYPHWGIVLFFVAHLPKELPKNLPPASKKGAGIQASVKLHSFYPGHVPLEENYAHCEIWTFKDGAKVQQPSLPALAKKEFRQIMSDRAFMVLRPKV
jgi:hypothetical protein